MGTSSAKVQQMAPEDFECEWDFENQFAMDQGATKTTTLSLCVTGDILTFRSVVENRPPPRPRRSLYYTVFEIFVHAERQSSNPTHFLVKEDRHTEKLLREAAPPRQDGSNSSSDDSSESDGYLTEDAETDLTEDKQSVVGEIVSLEMTTTLPRVTAFSTAITESTRSEAVFVRPDGVVCGRLQGTCMPWIPLERPEQPEPVL